MPRRTTEAEAILSTLNAEVVLAAVAWRAVRDNVEILPTSQDRNHILAYQRAERTLSQAILTWTKEYQETSSKEGA